MENVLKARQKRGIIMCKHLYRKFKQAFRRFMQWRKQTNPLKAAAVDVIVCAIILIGCSLI